VTAVAKYAWIGLTSARSNLAYAGEVAARTLFLGVILFIFLQLWKVTYAETGADRLAGLTLVEMLWYLAMTECMTLSTPRVAWEVDQDVRTGALAVQLIRPLSYPLYRVSVSLGERAVRYAMSAVVASLVALALVGPIRVSATGLVVFLAALPLAFVLDLLSYLLIGLGAFWLEDTTGLALIYSRVTMILGGMLLPLELFPDGLQAVARSLPFALVMYGPARLFVRPDVGFLAELLVKQTAFIVIFAGAVFLVHRAAMRRLFANGG
jgi:viologen exporter family transport system permease protein